MRRGAARLDASLRKNQAAASGLKKRLDGVKLAAGGLAAAFAIREIARVGDTYQNLQNRLKLVTDGEQELLAVTQELQAISQETRSGFEGTAEVFARVALSAKDLGRSDQELLDFTRSLNQAIILSGASAQEANAGLIQLSQGIASGALRGDELRSVLEQLPKVADVIAARLGVTRGELRKLGSEGKISADIVIDAFKQAEQQLDDEFGETVPTIGQAVTQFNNELLRLVGEGGGAFLEFLTDSVQGMTDLLKAFNDFGKQEIAPDALEDIGQMEDLLMGARLDLELMLAKLQEDPGNLAAQNRVRNLRREIERLEKRLGEFKEAEEETAKTIDLGAQAREEAVAKVQERIDLLQLERDIQRDGIENAKDFAKVVTEVREAREAGNEELAQALIREYDLAKAIAREKEEQEAAADAAEEMAERLRDQAEARTETNRGLDQEIALLQRELELNAEGVENAGERAQFELEFAAALATGNLELAARLARLEQLRLALDDQAEAQEKANEAQRDAAKAAREQEQALGQVADLLADNVGDALEDIFDKSKSTRESLSDLAEELLRFAAEQALKEALSAAFSSSGTSSGGGTNAFGAALTAIFSKKGNVFSGQRVVPFQRGGVLSGPTAFPLAGQQVGVAGEAGLEGVFPLTRDNRGNLAVSAAGAGGGRTVNLTQNINTPDADSFRRSRKQVRADAVALARDFN